MYYTINPVLREGTVMIDSISHWDYSLTLGEKFPNGITEPMEFEVDTDLQNTYLPVTFLPEPVFSIKLIHALQMAGVNNFDTYDVKILNPDNGETITGYKAINILGKIACADLAISDSDRIIENQYVFRKLVINPLKTYDFNLFRLAECTQVILIHERVVKQLPSELCKDLRFEPVGEV